MHDTSEHTIGACLQCQWFLLEDQENFRQANYQPETEIEAAATASAAAAIAAAATEAAATAAAATEAAATASAATAFAAAATASSSITFCELYGVDASVAHESLQRVGWDMQRSAEGLELFVAVRGAPVCI